MNQLLTTFFCLVPLISNFVVNRVYPHSTYNVALVWVFMSLFWMAAGVLIAYREGQWSPNAVHGSGRYINLIALAFMIIPICVNVAFVLSFVYPSVYFDRFELLINWLFFSPIVGLACVWMSYLAGTQNKTFHSSSTTEAFK